MNNEITHDDLLKAFVVETSNNYKLNKENEELKERLDRIKEIMNMWNYYLPDEALEEVKEILNE